MRRLFWIAVASSAVVLLLAFAVWPLCLVVARAIGLPEHFEPSRLITAFAAPQALAALLNTVLISTGVTVFAVLLGAPLGFVLSRTALPGARRLKTYLTLPAVVPPYLLGIAWIDLANPRTGLLNAAGQIVNIYGIGGIIWVLGLCFYPFVLLPVATALERMDASLEESARVAGAPPFTVFRQITLPLSLPAIVSGAVLVFLATAATFGVPYLLGTAGAVRTPVLTTAIVSEITVGGPESLGRAMALGRTPLALGGGGAPRRAGDSGRAALRGGLGQRRAAQADAAQARDSALASPRTMGGGDRRGGFAAPHPALGVAPQGLGRGARSGELVVRQLSPSALSKPPNPPRDRR
jgi:iron(III) transport system permease protein